MTEDELSPFDPPHGFSRWPLRDQVITVSCGAILVLGFGWLAVKALTPVKSFERERQEAARTRKAPRSRASPRRRRVRD